MPRFRIGYTTFEERIFGRFPTEAEARTAVTSLGAALHRQRMAGAIYRTPEGRHFRILSTGWAPGFTVWETLKVQEDR